MKKSMMKPLTVDRMLKSIILHSEELYKLVDNPATHEVALANIDEDKLREAYNTILRAYSKVKEEVRSNSK